MINFNTFTFQQTCPSMQVMLLEHWNKGIRIVKVSLTHMTACFGVTWQDHPNFWNPSCHKKTLHRKTVHTGRSRKAALIFLFGLETLLSRVSNALWSAVPSLRTTRLLAPAAVKTISDSFLCSARAWGQHCLFNVIIHILSQSPFVMSLISYRSIPA